MAYSKQLMLTLPTVHCALPFCIAPCLVHLVGSAVVEYDLVLVPEMSENAKYLCARGE